MDSSLRFCLCVSESSWAVFRSQSIVVPFGRKSSWKTKQIARCEAKAMKELEKEMREKVHQEREVRRRKGRSIGPGESV